MKGITVLTDCMLCPEMQMCKKIQKGVTPSIWNMTVLWDKIAYRSCISGTKVEFYQSIWYVQWKTKFHGKQKSVWKSRALFGLKNDKIAWQVHTSSLTPLLHLKWFSLKNSSFLKSANDDKWVMIVYCNTTMQKKTDQIGIKKECCPNWEKKRLWLLLQ